MSGDEVSDLVIFLVKYINTKALSKIMTETTVTRGGQITLTKDVREKLHIKEGDTVLLNLFGETILLSKKNPKAFETHNFLPASFPKILKEMKHFSYSKRLRKLGVL